MSYFWVTAGKFICKTGQVLEMASNLGKLAVVLKTRMVLIGDDIKVMFLEMQLHSEHAFNKK